MTGRWYGCLCHDFQGHTSSVRGCKTRAGHASLSRLIAILSWVLHVLGMGQVFCEGGGGALTSRDATWTQQ